MNRSERRRQRLSTLFLVFTFLLTVVGGPIFYAAAVVEDEDAFVAVADEVVTSPAVEEALSGTIAAVTFEAVAADDALAEALPEGLRTFTVPLTRIAVDEFTKVAVTALRSEGATEIRGSALREVHKQVTSGDDEVVIDLRAVLVRTARDVGGVAVGSGVAKAVSGTDAGRFVLAEAGSDESKLIGALTLLPDLGFWVAVSSLATLLVAIWLSVDRSRALIRGGLAIAGGAAIASLLVSLGLDVVLGDLGGGSAIGASVAGVISADFGEQQVGALIVGVLLAIIGLLLGERLSAITLRALPGDLWHRRPGVPEKLRRVLAENPALTRAAIWLTGVVGLSLWPQPTTRVLLTIMVLTGLLQVGAWLLIGTTRYALSLRQQFGLNLESPAEQAPGRQTGGLRANLAILGVLTFLIWPGWSPIVIERIFVLTGLLQAAIDVPALLRTARAHRVQEDTAAEVSKFRRHRLRYYLAAGVAVVAVTLGMAATAGSHDRIEASEECNGHVELCSLRVDEVVFAGSHNSMSSVDLGWELAMQTGDMVDQLDFGVRALLIDAIYWDTPSDPDFVDDSNTAAIEAALGDDEPQPGAWLCHAFCALGATELTGGLTEIALWLESHPREVLLIVVQDEVTEQDLTSAFVESGLRELAYVHTPGSEFPTLADLIEADTRMLVYGENQGEPGTWFQNAWESTLRETPFKFALQGEFSCDANRGNEANPLFLINHWLTTGIPVREAAIPVNSRSVLLERVNECLEERGRLPTILAVDFVETGDLISVVDELNQVGP